MWWDQGFFLRLRKAERNSGPVREEQGMGMSLWQGQGWREEIATRDWSQGVFREEVGSGRGMGCRRGDREMDLERRGRIDWGREEARVWGRSAGGSKCKGGMDLLGNTWELCL